MNTARQHAAEAARRWPLWFGLQSVIGFYGVNALLDEALAFFGITGWTLPPFAALVGAVSCAYAVTSYTRATSVPTGGESRPA